MNNADNSIATSGSVWSLLMESVRQLDRTHIEFDRQTAKHKAEFDRRTAEFEREIGERKAEFDRESAERKTLRILYNGDNQDEFCD
jgi:hypothetical protein